MATSAHPPSSASNLDDSFENGQEISTNDGILLRRAPAAYLTEIANNTTGTLSLVHYNHRNHQTNNNVLCIEWKPNDFLIADADSHENDDWSIVDTITKRQRTVSESLAFSCDTGPTAKAPNQPQPTQPNQQRASPIPPSVHAPRRIRIKINELLYVEVLKNNHLLRLVKKADAKVHSEYFFQHGNAEGFVRGLQTTHCLRRSAYKRDLYEIVDNVEHDKEKLQKTFAELRIDDIKGSGGGWISNMVRDPFGHTMGLLAKMSDAYTVFPGMSGENPHPGASSYRNDSAAVAPPSSNHRQPHLNHHPSEQTSPNSTLEEYEMLNGTNGSPPSDDEQRIRDLQDRLPERPSVVRGACLNAKQWSEFLTDDGRVTDVERVKEIIFRGGIEHGLRPDVWKYLLGYWRWDETADQRQRAQRQRSSEYFKMKMQWLSMTAVQEKNFLGYQNRKCQIEKDVQRTDRSIEYFAGDDNPNLSRLQDILMTYVMYNFDLGYVQGMSDLLAPILCIMEDEVDSFWCFVGFMDMMFTNFDMDQGGMKRQLRDLKELMSFCNPRLFAYFRKNESDNMYVCFRWLLVWFKREFTHYDIMSLWESMWTRLPCINFHLLISVAILDDQMDTIIGRSYEFNEILKFVNELSYKIDYSKMLAAAEAIYLQIKASDHLTDEIRAIIGEEIEANGSQDISEEDDDGFDTIVQTVKSVKDMYEEQKKIEEACQRSMYNSFF